MRVSTSMVFDAGVRTINTQTGKLLHLQQQVSTGRRIVTPADDPVAAARVLELTQASEVVEQFSTNRQNAEGALAMEESQLEGIGELIRRVRELAIQGGNGTLTRENRLANTAELRARFEELMGYANARDGSGKYLFSGYMGDTRPFSGSVETAAQAGVVYQGDDGQRLLQVSPSRILEISDSGKDIFQRIKNGNGTFVTDVNSANTGTAVIDAGAVTNPGAWDASTTHQVKINFYVDSTVQPPVTYYDLIDADPASPGVGNSLLTGGAPVVPSVNPGPPPTFSGAPGLRTYTSGQAIQLKSLPTEPAPFDLGSNVLVSGTPGDTDSFDIHPSTTQDLFATLGTLILDLEEATANESQNALLANRIGFALTNLDQAEQNILRVRAQIGSRLQEVSSLQSINEDIQIQYQQSISNLQDLDYAKTISDLTRKQTDLQAAQQSFVQISKLSLFNYL